MSAKKISQFNPLDSPVSLNDELLVNQIISGVPTTWRTTVKKLLGAVMPQPAITVLLWNSGPKTLEIECDGMLPNSIISVDGIYYPISAFVETTHPNYKATISIPAGLIAGDHTVVVSNMFINEITDIINI